MNATITAVVDSHPGLDGQRAVRYETADGSWAWIHGSGAIGDVIDVGEAPAAPSIDTAAAYSLSAFALAHGEIAFAHLVTVALHGEEWAVERVQHVLNNLSAMVPLSTDAPGDFDADRLAMMRSVSTTRPDGAIARSTVAP